MKTSSLSLFIKEETYCRWKHRNYLHPYPMAAWYYWHYSYCSICLTCRYHIGDLVFNWLLGHRFGSYEKRKHYFSIY